MSKRVTLSGLSEKFTAGEIEAIVRGFAEVVGGGGGLDSVSEKQLRLGNSAYDLLQAEMEDGPPPPAFPREANTDEEFYLVFADHARHHGVQNTWTAFWKQMRDGQLLIAESTLCAYLGAVTADLERFDADRAGREQWWVDKATVTVNDLSDGEVFSVDDGITWHACSSAVLQWPYCYAGAARGDDENAMTYKLPVPENASVWVVRRTA